MADDELSGRASAGLQKRDWRLGGGGPVGTMGPEPEGSVFDPVGRFITGEQGSLEALKQNVKGFSESPAVESGMAAPLRRALQTPEGAPGGPPMPQHQAPTYGGYGAMPQVDVPYYEGGATAEVDRINAKFDEDKAALESQLYGEQAPDVPTLAPDQYHAQLAKLQQERTVDLAKVATFSGSQMGRIDEVARGRVEGQQRQFESAIRIGEHEQKQADLQQARTQDLYSSAEMLHAEGVQRQRDYDEAFGQRMAEFEQANQELSQQRVDPERWYKNQSTGQKVLSIIAMAAGGYLAGAGKPALLQAQVKRVSDAINNDVDAQRADLANRRAGLAAQGTLLGRMRQHFGDMQAATLATKRHLYQRYAMQLQTMAATTRSVRAKEQLGLLSGAMEQAANEAEIGLQLQAEAYATDLQNRMAAGRMMGLQQQQYSDALQAAGLGGFQPYKGKENQVVWGFGVARGQSEKRAGELQDMAAEWRLEDQELGRLIEIAESGNKGLVPLSDAQAEFEQRFQNMRIPVKKEVAGAAENEGEAKAIDISLGRVSGDVGQAMGLTAKALRRRREYRQREMQTKLKSRGVIPAEVKYGPSEKHPERPAPYVRYGKPETGPQVRSGPKPE